MTGDRGGYGVLAHRRGCCYVVGLTPDGMGQRPLQQGGDVYGRCDWRSDDPTARWITGTRPKAHGDLMAENDRVFLNSGYAHADLDRVWRLPSRSNTLREKRAKFGEILAYRYHISL
jgi:hypothetical protein